MLNWTSDSEINVLGFNIYREEDGKRIAINQQLVTNSVLTVSPNAVSLADHSYEFLDISSVKERATYWLEALDLNGNATWKGPFTVEVAADNFISPETDQALTLAMQSQTGKPSSPVELRAALSQPDLLAAKISAPTGQTKSFKLNVTREGWYTISKAELIAAGLNPSVDPRKLQIYADNIPQAILVKGQDDGRLNENDSLQFYAQGIDSPYSNSRVYWLSEGKSNGLRMPIPANAATASASVSFPYSVERRDKTVYFSSLLNGSKENFFGAVIARTPLNQTLTLKHLDSSTSQEATLQVSLQGVTWYDHTVEVKINGYAVGQLEYFGLFLGEATFSIPHTFLMEGQNVVTFTPLGGNSDINLVDTIRLTYQHTYTTDEDYLRVSCKGSQSFTIWGFSNDAIEVFDVTQAASVRNLRGQVVSRKKESDGSIEFGISLAVTGGEQRELLALTQNRFSNVAKISLDSPSDLKNPENRADFVIITSNNLLPAAEELQKLRKAQGLSVVVVDIEDIYDEFSFGQKNPQAVKDFLNYAKTSWRQPVTYVLFIGDASYDPKNYLGCGELDLVPSKLMDTLFLETATDDWFADFNDDGISDLAIGRLPARNASEANIMVSKILAYEDTEPSNEVLMVSDINDVYNFEGANQSLVGLLPADSNVIFVKRSQMSDSQSRMAIIENLNRGPRIVNYAGHGSINLWRGNLFTNADAMNLQNKEHLTMVVTMNCLNGYFQDPVVDGLSEALLKAPQGGAVAAWGSSALTFAEEQAPVNREFYRLIFNNSSAGITIGEAAMRAKAMTEDIDVRCSWILFGDPTMRLK